MDRRKVIARALQEGMDQTVGFFKSMPAEQLGLTVYQDGARWTVQQVLAHLVTIEKSMHRLFDNILSGGEGSPKDFDVDRFNKSQTSKLDGIELDELIRRFKQVRGKTIAMVQAMTEQDLGRQGYHAFHGQGRLERFICWAYEHARLHEDDIQNFLHKKKD